MKKITLTDLAKANRTWFGEGNREFFGDIDYRIVERDEVQYFLQVTKKWTKDTYYIVKDIKENLRIGGVVIEFNSEVELNKWLNI